MKGYWLRILVAWLLLRCAGAVVKDAENLLRKNADVHDLSVIEGHVVEAGS